MELKIINQFFPVCKLKDLSQVDWASPFCFLGKTDEELSLVCETECVPSNTVDREGYTVIQQYKTPYWYGVLILLLYFYFSRTGIHTSL
ncbi:MAG: hypothetical protein QM215_04775 [Bacillota bacterium]|nr:hypothetical protein [Bacillota bacterium]